MVVCMRTVCDICKKEFEVQIQEPLVKNINCFVSCFWCPECKKIYAFAIKDEKYFELLQSLNEIKQRLRKLKNKKVKNVNKINKLVDIYFLKQNRLARHVENLKKKYNGTFTFATCENNSEEIIYLPYKNTDMEEIKNG